MLLEKKRSKKNERQKITNAIIENEERDEKKIAKRRESLYIHNSLFLLYDFLYIFFQLWSLIYQIKICKNSKENNYTKSIEILQQ